MNAVSHHSLADSSFLITGGTGSFGRAFVSFALEHFAPQRIVVFSRDETKQREMRIAYDNDDRIRWFLGDIRDRDRLRRALEGVDHVIHAAALKQVDTGEYNAFEFVKTNIIGSQNVIDAAIDSGVRRVIALSTDKASSPINLYGATKLTADKLFVSANNFSHSTGTRFAVVRYGNVLGSRGSVVPLFQHLIQNGAPLPITDRRMTRFWISLDQAAAFVGHALNEMAGGELFVPKLPSMRLQDLAEALAPGHPTNEIGIRPGEKLHEEMISPDESSRTLEQKDRYVLLPTLADWGEVSVAGQKVAEGFSYRSDTNSDWLGPRELRELLH